MGKLTSGFCRKLVLTSVFRIFYNCLSGINLQVPNPGRSCRHFNLKLFLVLMLLLVSAGKNTIAQVIVPFKPRYQVQQRGGILYLSNNILTAGSKVSNGKQNISTAINESPPGGSAINDDYFTSYIDADTDPATVNSSSSSLTLQTCSKITFAGLYWGGATDNNATIRGTAKLKLPGGSYTIVTADEDFGIFDTHHYQSFKDITAMVNANPGGTTGDYWMADIDARVGQSAMEAGWTLVIVFQNDLSPSYRNLTVFDGFAGMRSTGAQYDIPISGFLTPPAGPVSFELGFVAYEGDRGIKGDFLSFDDNKVADAAHDDDNTFNSSITYDGAVVTSRNPAHKNTMGYDASIMMFPNAKSSVSLGNNVSSAKITLDTDGDRYAIGVITTAIDVLNPFFTFSQAVTNIANPGQPLKLGETVEISYTFRNIGNDASTNTVLSNVLSPLLTDISDLEVRYDTGPWLSYTDAIGDDQAGFDPATGRITFRVGTGAMALNGGKIDTGKTVNVRFRVKLTSDCDLLRCSASAITNLGVLNYFGNVNSGDSWTLNSSPVPATGQCDPTSGAISIPIEIPAQCSAPFPDLTFRIACQTDVTLFGLPANYLVYASADTLFANPLNAVSTAGMYTARRVIANGCDDRFKIFIAVSPLGSDMNSVSPATCFGTATGSIVVNPSGGTAPYAYLWNTGAATKDLINIAAGTYTVTITDAFGCTLVKTFVVVQPQQLAAALTQTNSSCAGANNGSIDATVTGGTAPYTYSWSNGSQSQNLTGLAPGSYSLTVTDSKFCSITETVILTEPDQILITDSSVNLSCFGSADGSISLNPSGGTAPYTYLWTNGETVSSLNNLMAGTYSVTVTDAMGCNAIRTINILQPTALNLSVLASNITCAGDSTGAANLNLTGGIAPYTFNWSNGATTQNLSSIPAGTYTVLVTDATGCSATSTVTVTEPPSLNLSVNLTDVQCFGDSNGAINLTVSGGVSPYTYSWSNPAVATEDLSGLSAGNYSVTVTDSNGCTAILPVSISQPPSPLSISTVLVSQVTCFNGDDGSIDIAVSGGVAPYNFTWAGGQLSEDVGNLKAGNYSVEITDANGCTQMMAYTITQPDEIKPVFSKVNPVCVGENTGSITITNITGGIAPYSFSWTKDGVALPSPDLSALSAGAYEVSITDQSGCTVLLRVVLNDPVPIRINVTQIDLICIGTDPSLSFSIDISGGTGPYTRIYTPIDSTTSLLTVRDALGCEESLVVPYSVEPPIIVESSHKDVLCFGDLTGEISISVTGGNGPYQYSWSDDPANSALNVPVRMGLQAGIYRVIITDGSGCELNALVVEVKQPAAAVGISLIGLTAVTCEGGADGSITVDVTGGSPNYSYLWSNGATTKNLSNLTAGNYSLTVTDAVSCEQESMLFEVTAPAPIVISPVITNVTCNGLSNGTINVSVTGGTGPYSLRWDDLPSGPFNSTRSGLPAGTYGLTITDAAGCTAFKSISIRQPQALVLAGRSTDVKCFGEANGSLIVEIIGGTAPYTYLGSPVNSMFQLSNLPAGSVSVTVADAQGCEQTISANILQPQPLNFAAALVNVSCTGLSDGSISLTGSGGTAPYTYQWSTGAQSADLINQPAGQYAVIITDSQGCSFNISNIVITEPVPLAVQSTTTNVLCFGGNSGSINLTVAGGTLPYRFIWNNGSQTEDLANIAAGTYSVLVVDARNCQIQTSVNVSQPVAPLNYTATRVNNTCFGDRGGSISITAIGGTAPYQILWDTGETSWMRNGLASGTYSGIITDASGCTTTVAVQVLEPTLLILTLAKADNICPQGTEGRATVNVTGGVAPYNYLWSNGNTASQIAGLPAGMYSVTVTDAKGCVSAASVVIEQPNPFSIAVAQKTDVNCFGATTGALAITVNGGNGPYFFEWSNGATTQNISSIPQGAYTVKVTDINGCSTISATMVINQPAQPLSATAVAQNALCYQDASGAVTLNVSGGTQGYNYLWNDGSTLANRSNLPAGSYSVTVTDAGGCTFQLNVDVTEPGPLTVLVNKTDVDCFGEATGSIQLNVSGGTPNYTYIWTRDNIALPNPDLNALTAGTYQVTVSDARNCNQVTRSIIIGGPQAILNLSVVKTTGADCSDGTNGIIEVLASGGTAPYLYSLDGLTFKSAGTFSGLPPGNYVLHVRDAKDCSTIQAATIIRGNCAPLAVDDSFTGGQDSPVGGSVARNDSDPDGDPLRFTLITPPPNGTITFNDDGSFVFVPAPGWTGSTDFEYEVCDAQGACTRAKVTIVVSRPNTPPVAGDDNFNGGENSPVGGSVARNDNDPDGDPLRFTLITQPANGTITFNDDGSFIFVPAPGWSGSTGFEYEVCDAQGACIRAKVTIVVARPNTPPVAGDDQFNTPAGKPYSATVIENDYDIDSDTLNYTLISQPANGSVTLNADGSFTYSPNPGYSGEDIFTYRVCDPSGACDEARVTLLSTEIAEVSLTPDYTEIPEGNRVNITAVLDRMVNVDVTVTLAYSGDAEEGKDYYLFEDFLTITIPAGKIQGSQYFAVGALIDDLKEKPEHVFATIAEVSSNLVRIGKGAEVVILDVYPPARGISDNENPDIKPNPLFSPNGDGQGNDRFLIGNINLYPDNQVLIFNRWGNEVFRTNGYNNSGNSFEGVANTGLLTNLNKDLPEGVYYYVIYTTDLDSKKKLNKGYLILKR